MLYERERERERERQTDRQTERQRERQRETGRKTDRQKETDKQADRQTDIHTERTNNYCLKMLNRISFINFFAVSLKGIFLPKLCYNQCLRKYTFQNGQSLPVEGMDK